MTDLREAVESAVAAGQHPVLFSFLASGTTFTRLLIQDWIRTPVWQENWHTNGEWPYFDGKPVEPRVTITFRIEEAMKQGWGPFFHLVRHPMRTWESATALSVGQKQHHSLCDYLRPAIDWRRCEESDALCMLRALTSFTRLVEGLRLPRFRVEDLGEPGHNPHVKGDRTPLDQLWLRAEQLNAQAATYLRTISLSHGYGYR